MKNLFGQSTYFEFGLINKKFGVFRALKYFLEYLYYTVIAGKYRISADNIEKKKYYVAVCGIFKNEGPYLKEWIDHHINIGIEHFYLYNNNSTDNYAEILNPYIDSNWVTLIDWPREHVQLEAYEDCIKMYAEEANWIGFIDIDEFIMLREDIQSISNVLGSFLERGSVLLYWRVFGSSGITERDVTRPVLEDFQSCWSKFRINGKCFFNTAFTFKRNNQKNGAFHHRLWGEYNGKALPPVNCDDHFSFWCFNIADDAFPEAWINHYCIKSLNEFKDRLKKGSVFYQKMPTDMNYFYYYDGKCDSNTGKEHQKRMEYLRIHNLPKESR